MPRSYLNVMARNYTYWYELKTTQSGFHIIGHDPLMAIDKQAGINSLPGLNLLGAIAMERIQH